MVPVFWHPLAQEIRNDVKHCETLWNDEGLYSLDRVPPRFTKPRCISAHQGISKCHSGEFGQLVLTCQLLYSVFQCLSHRNLSLYGGLHTQIEVVQETVNWWPGRRQIPRRTWSTDIPRSSQRKSKSRRHGCQWWKWTGWGSRGARGVVRRFVWKCGSGDPGNGGSQEKSWRNEAISQKEGASWCHFRAEGDLPLNMTVRSC